MKLIPTTTSSKLDEKLTGVKGTDSG